MLTNDNSELLAVNQQFYEAFGSLDIELMDTIWTHDTDVFCIHPGWEPLITWDSIHSSWANIFANSTLMMFNIEILKIIKHSDIGVIICKENVSSLINGRATNFSVVAVNTYKLNFENWKLASHHGSPV